jgi:hypothetical protein
VPDAHVCFSVGIGSDYDGIGDVPVGLEDVSTYPALVGVYISYGGHVLTVLSFCTRLLSFTVVDGTSTSSAA